MYNEIGEQLGLLGKYQSLFREKPHMMNVLEMIYVDILEFHAKALSYFRQKRMLFSTLFSFLLSARILSSLADLHRSMEATLPPHVEELPHTLQRHDPKLQETQVPHRKPGNARPVRGDLRHPKTPSRATNASERGSRETPCPGDAGLVGCRKHVGTSRPLLGAETRISRLWKMDPEKESG